MKSVMLIILVLFSASSFVLAQKVSISDINESLL
jgi:hypothetical protein